MSVYTEADRKKDEGKEHVVQAYKCILAAADDETSGNNEFSQDYIETLENSLTALRKIKREL